MINQEQLRKKLGTVSIEEIAKIKLFSKRNDGKIKPLDFVLSFFISIQTAQHSLTNWALQLSVLLRQTLSYNGMKNAQNQDRANFAKALLQSVVQDQLDKSNQPNLKTQLLEKFNRVFLEDSTCIKLPHYLHRFFPGAHSSKRKAATAKIQFRQELKSGTCTHFELQSFRDNDQKFSPNILGILLPGDLVIRDLGYWVLAFFKKIITAEAFFVSRLRFNVNLYNIENGKAINLNKLLRKAQRNKQKAVDIQVIVGKAEQVEGRIVAIKCPPNVTRKRRKAARNNRSAKANHSKEYMERLGWTIFFTNLPAEEVTPNEIMQMYGYRWRIEIVFKCWKSYFNIDQLFNSQTKPTKQQVEIAFYLFLVWLTLFFVKMYNYFLYEIFTKRQKMLSLMKFAKFIKEHLSALLADPDSEYWLDHLAYYCCYKERKERLNFCEQFYLTI